MRCRKAVLRRNFIHHKKGNRLDTAQQSGTGINLHNISNAWLLMVVVLGVEFLAKLE